VQRDWAFGGLKGVKSQWSVAGREAPGRPGGFVSSCLTGSHSRQIMVLVLNRTGPFPCGGIGGLVDVVRRSYQRSLNQHLLSPLMGKL
jgi:hypothetical protein